MSDPLRKAVEWMRWWVDLAECDCEHGHVCGLPERRAECVAAEKALAEQGTEWQFIGSDSGNATGGVTTCESFDSEDAALSEAEPWLEDDGPLRDTEWAKLQKRTTGPWETVKEWKP